MKRLLLTALLGSAFLLSPAVLAQEAPATPTPAFQAAPLSAASFGHLSSYPSLVQARLALEAAQLQAKTADFPLAGSIGANTTRILNSSDVPEICASNALLKFTAYCAPLPDSIQTVNASLRYMPFNVGDVGARRALAHLGVEQAQLGYQTALANLQGQAILATQRVQLAGNALKLAQQAQQTAQMALKVTQNRVQGGGATQNDLMAAQLAAAQADAAVAQATDGLKVAQETLQDLTGSADVPAVSAVTPPANGKSMAVANAELAVKRAQVTLKQTTWNSLPTVQLAYNHAFNPGNAGNVTSMGLAIDSHNAVPTATLSYVPVTAPQNRIGDQITLGVNFDASAATFSGPVLAQNALAQAQAGVEAAQRQAGIQVDGLNAAYAQATRDAALKQQALANAQQVQKDAESRRDLGLASPLEAAQAAVATFQAQLAADQAALNVQDAALKFYSFFGTPLF